MKSFRRFISYATLWRNTSRKTSGSKVVISWYISEKVSKFDLKNVPIESLSENDKELLEAKANAAIEEFYKIRWSKNKDAKEYLQADQNKYSDPRKDTWMFKNGK